MNNELILSSF